MNWDCAQTEARLSGYLDATLTAPEQRAADAHIATCARCAEWRDARQAVVWLRRVEPLAVPLGLETRILARTTGRAPRVSAWEALAHGWRMLWQPRVALSAAAVLFSLGLVLRALDINVRTLSASDLRPTTIYRKLDRTAHVAYGRGVKFVNDLRLVYEIRSRLDALKPMTEESTPPPPTQPPAQEKKPERKFTDDGSVRRLYARSLLGPARYTP